VLKITSEKTNYKDRIRKFKYPSDADLRYNLWTPRAPPFDPVIALKDISQPLCPKYIFLQKIKGRQLHPHIIFRAPGQAIDDDTVFRHFFRLKTAFDSAVIEILKFLVWNKEGSRLIDIPVETIQWRNLFSQFIDAESRDVIQFLSKLFQRLQNEGTLERYKNSKGKIFFNFQVFNPKIIIPPSEESVPYELALRRTERNPNPYRFRWEDSFPGYSIINEMNLSHIYFILQIL